MSAQDTGGRGELPAMRPRPVTVGVDLGGTKIAAVVCDAQATVLHRLWRTHDADGYEDCLGLVEQAVRDCESAARGEWTVTAVGLSLAAWIGPDRRRVLRAANLGFADRPLAADLARRLGRPVVLENDGNMALWAEAVHGAARGTRDVVLLALGTGVGGGVVVDGRLLGGAGGLAGELGHVPVSDTGPECVCGGRGCLELYAGGPALVAAARRDLVPLGGTGSGGTGEPTAADVVAAATRGDRAARTVLERAGHAVGVAVARLVPVLDPELVLLAGSLAFAGREVLLPAARAALAGHLILPGLRQPPRIDLAACGPEAGAVGAAARARTEAPQPLPAAG